MAKGLKVLPALLQTIPDVPHPLSIDAAALLGTSRRTSSGENRIHPPTDRAEVQRDRERFGGAHVRVKRRRELRMRALRMDEPVRDGGAWR
jgi:hypothetical protein